MHLSCICVNQDEVNLKEIKLKWKNKERFTEKGSWPDQLDGSYLTYGWVLIFSPLAAQGKGASLRLLHIFVILRKAASSVNSL